MENSPQDYDIPVITMASEAPDHANDALARYFRAALKRLDYVEHGDPRDFILRKGTRDESHTPLSKVWVPAIVRNEASANADDTVEKMLDDGNTARLVLSEPGGGKSTLARYIVCKALRKALAQEGQRFGVFEERLPNAQLNSSN